MKRYPLLALLVLTAGCQPEGVVLRGSLAVDGERCAGAGVDRVYVRGSADTAVVRDCSFRLVVPDSGELVLGFADAKKETARMYLGGVPARSRVTLRRIGFDERGLAFPGSVSLRGAQAIGINGLREADARALPRVVSTDGEVLSVEAGAGLLLVRPEDARLPDLRVRVEPTATIRTTAHAAGSLAKLDFGDRVRVEGATRNGVVLARYVVVPEPEAPPPPAPPERTRGIWEELGRLLDILGV